MRNQGQKKEKLNGERWENKKESRDRQEGKSKGKE
jgi:hypothetical protein